MAAALLDSLRTCLEPVDRSGSDPCGSNPVGVRLSPSALSPPRDRVAGNRPALHAAPRGFDSLRFHPHPRSSVGAEHRASNADAAGSSPAGGTTLTHTREGTGH